MVEQHAPRLSRTFAALSDATRRAIVIRLGHENRLSVSEISRPFAMTLPAVMKHLNVLSEAGLIVRQKRGRVMECWLNPTPIDEAAQWLEDHRRFWSGSLDKLAALVEQEGDDEHDDENP